VSTTLSSPHYRHKVFQLILNYRNYPVFGHPLFSDTPIGVGSGAAFWLYAVLGPQFLNTRVVCFITKTQKIAHRVDHVS